MHPVVQAKTRASFLISPFPSLTTSKDQDLLYKCLPYLSSLPVAPPTKLQLSLVWTTNETSKTDLPDPLLSPYSKVKLVCLGQFQFSPVA